MKYRTLKRAFALFLTIMMLLPNYSKLAFAFDTTSLGSNMNETSLSEEQLFIELAEAEEIAKLFLADALLLEDVTWDEGTEIINNVVLYDETGSGSISAYSFEMTTGYIIVAAHLDASNLIMEWSDQAEPVYQELELSDGDAVVYCGALNYYRDSGQDELESIDGISVARDEIQNVLEETSSISNISPEVLESIQNPVQTASNGSSSSPITDPFDHAKTWYDQSTYSNIRASLRNNRLTYLALSGHACYGDHAVVCYAYTRLQSDTTGYYKTYLKIADGWSLSPRYLDLASATSDVYWEVIP